MQIFTRNWILTAMSKQELTTNDDLQHYLCILVFKEHLIAYQSVQSEPWQLLDIKGSQQYAHKDKTSSLKDVLSDISANLNLKDGLAKVKVSLLYQQGQDHLLIDVVKTLQEYQSKTWQILNWESIYQYALQILNIEQVFFDAKTVDHQWVQDHVLPLVWHENSIEHQQQALAALRQEKNQIEEQLALMRSDAEQALAQQVNKLENDKQQLQQYISEARAQLQKLQQPDLESLLVFLPAIFKDFWNVVRPDELAMIVSVLNIPSVPSPYHSPSLSTVQQKKRQFLALSEESQGKILDLCRELVHNHNALQVHQEFKALVGALD
jgi:hypothetical protein